MAIKQISPQDAKELLDDNANAVYVDVRSEAEFQMGHPEGAYNVPLKHLNVTVQQLEDNPDFLDVMEACFEKGAKLLLGCASGNRSQTACMMLQKRGFEDLANIQGGFSGARDMFGNIATPGWMQLNYPAEQGSGEERGYRHLKEKS